MFKQPSELEIPTSVEPALSRILAWPRPHSTEAELQFRKYLAAEIERITGETPLTLAGGSLYAVVLTKDDALPSTLFSSHMDTAESAEHGKLGEDNQPKRKSLTYDPHMGIIGLSKDSSGGCLGADDGVGVWIMLCLLEAKVPGGYIFHTGEEQGGIGAREVLRNHTEMLKHFDVAVAFDRPGDYEVITHQGGAECASAKFAAALCSQLRALGLGQYIPSARGVFTDTKVYRGVIAECTNVGAGYTSQHTRQEDLDYGHALQLRDACLKLDWESLPVDRDPEEAPVWLNSGRVLPSSPPPPPQATRPPVVAVTQDYELMDSEFESISNTPRQDLDEWIVSDPETAGDTMLRLALEIAQLRAEVMFLRQRVFKVQSGP